MVSYEAINAHADVVAPFAPTIGSFGQIEMPAVITCASNFYFSGSGSSLREWHAVCPVMC